MSYYSEHKEGFWGTVVVHAMLLAILLHFGFFTKLPLPAEEGVLIDFGNSDNGFGVEEPAPGMAQNASPAPTKTIETPAEPASTPPPVAATTPPAAAKPVPAAAQPKEELLTQDYEKTIALETAKKKKQADEKKKQQELEQQREWQRQQKLQADKKKAEELERQRVAAVQTEQRRQAQAEQQRQAAEAEKQRLAEAERQRKAKEEQAKKDAEAQKLAQINNRAANAFGAGKAPSGSGSGNGDANSKSTGQGVTFPGGNQGNPNGGRSDKYGNGGSGSGSTGSGPSFSLGGRSAVALPKPSYPGNESGKVVVGIKVDKSGRVTSANPGERGTTVFTPSLLEAARQAALRATFNADPDAAISQTGSITYIFNVE